MKTVGEKIRAWLDEIGADGLMYPNAPNMPKDAVLIKGYDLEAFMNASHLIDPRRVPAFRHADGGYHQFPEYCAKCEGDNAINCFGQGSCQSCKDWLAHKEATK